MREKGNCALFGQVANHRFHPTGLSRLDFGSCGVIVRCLMQNSSLETRRAGYAPVVGRSVFVSH
jgi:hypothetical protein